MNWNSITKSFKAYLQLECSLSENSVDAYLKDIKKLEEFDKWKGSNEQVDDVCIIGVQV